MSNMKAELLMRERRVLEVGFVEVVVWQLPEPLSGSTHSLKYRLAYVVANECVLRYDNEAGKGDHRHVGSQRPFVDKLGGANMKVRHRFNPPGDNPCPTSTVS
jgi:hypothetical protein